MGLDNVLGVILQPLMGHFSDRLKRRAGSRVPIIIVVAPAAAVPFILIPWAGSLPVLLLFVISFAFLANCSRIVTESLLPDYVSREHRSRANGALKIATSLTIVSSSLVSLFVVDHNPHLAFTIPALFMLVCFAVVGFALRQIPARGTSRDPAPPAEEGPDAQESAQDRPFLRIVVEAFRDRRRSGSCWASFASRGRGPGCGRSPRPTPRRCWDVPRCRRGADPPGRDRLPRGRRADRVPLRPGRAGRMIAFGVGVFILGTLGAFAWQTPVGTSVFLAVASVGYACSAVNAVVAIWNSAPDEHALGTYTGLYTVAASSGAAIGPAVMGWTIDVTSWSTMFVNAAVVAVVPLLIFARLGRPATGPHHARTPG